MSTAGEKMEQVNNNSNPGKRIQSALGPVLSLAYFFYFWFAVKPVLIYQSREPIFFFNERFFYEHLAYPGGWTNWLAALIAQSTYWNWLGAFVYTALFISILHGTRLFIRTLGFKQAWLAAMLPGLGFLYLHSQYPFDLSFTIGFLITLWITVLLLKVYPQNTVIRLILEMILLGFLYVFTGGAFWIFALTLSFIEILRKKKRIAGIGLLILSILIPMIAWRWIFLISLHESFFHLFSATQSKSLILPVTIIIAAYYPALVLISLFNISLPKKFSKSRIMRYQTLFSSVLYVVLAVLIATSSIDIKRKRFLTASRHARLHEWVHVLQVVQSGPANDWRLVFLGNRALFHLKRLGDDMFTLPQHWGVQGLMMKEETGYSYPLLYSDLYFDMGHMNEAERWGHESMSIRGETAWTLERLAFVNMAKGETDAAHVFLSKLACTVFQKKFAEHYLALLNDPEKLNKDPEIMRLRSRMLNPEPDFLYYADYPSVTFERILSNNPKNEMAFEYLMALYLLEGNIKGVAENCSKLPEMGYRRMPKAYDEAFLLYSVMQRQQKITYPKGLAGNAMTFTRFKEFQTIISKYGKQPQLAYAALQQKYGDTLWFYMKYLMPKE